MLAIVNDPAADPNEKEMAIDTMVEALFPQYDREKGYGISLEDADEGCIEYTQDGQTVKAELDREEATFSENLARLMEEKGISQVQLAEKASVGQPAISNMLKRNCRPQQRTVRKLAEALGVDPEELWPFNRTTE
jgi:lambda repressor-like predicted transcriptional regulator